MFDPVFLSDPSFKSTFAQNKSCRSYRTLQLLFWPNFKCPYEISSFGRSNASQFQSNEITVPSLFSPVHHRSRRRRRHASRRRAHRRLSVSAAKSDAKSGFASSFPFPRPCGARSGAEQSPTAVGAALAVLRRLAAISSRLEPSRSSSTPSSTSNALPRARFRRSAAGIAPATAGRH